MNVKKIAWMGWAFLAVVIFISGIAVYNSSNSSYEPKSEKINHNEIELKSSAESINGNTNQYYLFKLQIPATIRYFNTNPWTADYEENIMAENADIYANEVLIGKTDANGYFEKELECYKTYEIKVRKTDYSEGRLRMFTDCSSLSELFEEKIFKDVKNVEEPNLSDSNYSGGQPPTSATGQGSV